MAQGSLTFKQTPDPGGGLLFKPGARKRFFREYETVMSDQFTNRVAGEQTNLRRALYQQALRLQRAVIEGNAYSSFRPRGGGGVRPGVQDELIAVPGPGLGKNPTPDTGDGV